MPTVPTSRNAIIALIKEHGPITAAEITDLLEWPRRRVNSCITKSRQDHGPKYFYIVRYKRQRGNAGREAPVYGVGPGKDAKRPVMDTLEENRKRQARYRERNREVINLRNRVRRSGYVTSPFEHLLRMTA